MPEVGGDGVFWRALDGEFEVGRRGRVRVGRERGGGDGEASGLVGERGDVDVEPLAGEELVGVRWGIVGGSGEVPLWSHLRRWQGG